MGGCWRIGNFTTREWHTGYEDLEGTLGDEEGDAYLKENEIHAVAAVTIRPEDYEKAKEVMLYIIEKLGGYFCGDTADFTPVVAAKKN